MPTRGFIWRTRLLAPLSAPRPAARLPHTLRAQSDAQTVTDWARTQPAPFVGTAWRKGEVIAEYLTRWVFVWEGAAPTARPWHLLVRREIGGSQLKFCFSNAKPQASLRRLASMQADRHFVERAFEDAKSTCGMADYQAPHPRNLALSHVGL